VSDDILKLDNVSFGYGDNRILNGFSMKLGKGEFLGITGRSGKGKTSLLGLCAGLLKPDSGEVLRNYARASFVFQNYRLLPWKTVSENIVFPLKGRVPDDESFEKAEKYMRMFEIGDACDLRPSQISGGMAQRTALARALINEPDIIFMDEPFSALDSVLREKAANLVRSYCEENGCSLMLISHFSSDIGMCGSVISV